MFNEEELLKMKISSQYGRLSQSSYNKDFEQLERKVKAHYNDLLKDPDISDVLDIEVYSNLDKEYLGSRILLTSGGPNVFLDTRFGLIEGYWYSEKYSFKADPSLVCQIDSYIEYEWNKK